ncbi:DNA cytosine methyltransferase [Ideonella sp. YS5]|uniref:DNA cytosine methyltransferase n=1 Tax=Ideonella sp. YS5 TaxID=3453714 RepID=UPI003EEB02B8
MDICVRRLGLHRGAPRLYLDSPALVRAGFEPGLPIRVLCDTENARVVVEVNSEGNRRVSRKTRGACVVPVIDLNNQADLQPIAALGVVRVVLMRGVIHILAIACQARALERATRMYRRLQSKEPVRCASVAFGAGITNWALHAGLAAAGVDTRLTFVNEIDEDLVTHSSTVHPLIDGATVVVNAPMQEAVADAWLLRRIGHVDVLEAGIPCSGASRAGVAKRKLQRMEDHPLVGHLVAAVIQWIAAMQPAIFFTENVPDYATSASASILRAWLRDAGYAVQETVLDASEFGSIEGRRRWFLVAHPPALDLQLGSRAASETPAGTLGDFLDRIDDDDPSWRAVAYLKDKELRDANKGSCFAMQWLTPESSRVPTLRKGYHKGGSTDPRLRHPTRPYLSRLLTPAEHARIKGIPAELVANLSATACHEACGQAVDTRPVQAIGQWLGMALRRMGRPNRDTCSNAQLDDKIAA